MAGDFDDYPPTPAEARAADIATRSAAILNKFTVMGKTGQFDWVHYDHRALAEYAAARDIQADVLALDLALTKATLARVRAERDDLARRLAGIVSAAGA